MRALPTLAALVVLPLAGCIEDRLAVEALTLVRPDGSCLRRVEYRLERVDTAKADAPVPIPAAEDPLRVLHRIPTGDPWNVRETAGEGTRSILAEAELPAPCSVDFDYWRQAAPAARPARNHMSLALDTTDAQTLYDYAESFVDPASPLRAAQLLSRALASREEAFAKALEKSLDGRKLDRRAVREAFRQRLAAPLSRAVAVLAQRAPRGARELREVEDLIEKGSFEADLVAALAGLPQGLAQADAKQAVGDALAALQPGIEKDLAAQGIPIEAAFPEMQEPRPRIRFRVTLTMPGPILKANTCTQGDTATWEFEGEDLYGRGFEMWATASLER